MKNPNRILCLLLSVLCAACALSACKRSPGAPAIPADAGTGAGTAPAENAQTADSAPDAGADLPARTIDDSLNVIFRNALSDGTIWGEATENKEDLCIHYTTDGEILRIASLEPTGPGGIKYGVTEDVVLLTKDRFYDTTDMSDVTARYYDAAAGETLADVIVRENGDMEFVIRKVVETFEEKHPELRLVDKTGRELYTVSCTAEEIERRYGVKHEEGELYDEEITIRYAGGGVYSLMLKEAPSGLYPTTVLFRTDSDVFRKIKSFRETFFFSDGATVYGRYVSGYAGGTEIVDWQTGNTASFPEGYAPAEGLALGGGLIKVHAITRAFEPADAFVDLGGKMKIDLSQYPQSVFGANAFHGSTAWLAFSNGYVGAIDTEGKLRFEPVKGKLSKIDLPSDLDFVVIENEQDESGKRILFPDGRTQEIPDCPKYAQLHTVRTDNGVYLLYDHYHAVRVDLTAPAA